MRFLVEQYIASKLDRPGFRGMIQSECSPVEVASKAAADVDRLCRYHLGFAPEIQVYGRKQDTFTAIPTHLYYIMCELLKNSCRATVEHARSKGQLSDDSNASTLSHGLPHGLLLPSVKVIIARGREDMTIKIEDRGGGIKRSDLELVWSYMFSTAPKPNPELFGSVPLDHMTGYSRRQLSTELELTPNKNSTFAFAGWGIGLPLARLYARYFGGSLKLRPLEGYGTDTYVHLHRLRTNSRELIPEALGDTFERMGADGRMCTGQIAAIASCQSTLLPLLPLLSFHACMHSEQLVRYADNAASSLQQRPNYRVSWRQGSSVKSIEDDSVARRLLKECCAASPNDNESHYDTDTDSDCDEISSAAQSSSINNDWSSSALAIDIASSSSSTVGYNRNSTMVIKSSTYTTTDSV
eukprot:20499-Heterococcus_DN1.PRE.1